MRSNYKIKRHGGLVEGAEPIDIITRYEKVPVAVFEEEHLGAEYVATMVAKSINATATAQKPFVIGLTTGKTPFGVYKSLVDMCKNGDVSFENVVMFSLDEFYPISPKEHQSRYFRIHDELVDHINIKPENVHIPSGEIAIDHVTTYCKQYEDLIHQYGGLDLLLLGVGTKGQVGFNESGSFRNTRTRLVAMSNDTRKSVGSLFYGAENTPKKAITIGLSTMMDAKKVVLMAWGEEKAHVVKAITEGEVTEVVPATCFQQHNNVQMIVDSSASEELIRVNTPWLVGSCDWEPKFVRKAVLWLCGVANKPVLKLTYQDYIDNNLGQLLESAGTYDQINIKVFNDLQHTITGWPGGKPNADDTTRPERSTPFPKRVVVFSPHPDDDVISMGGTLLRLADQGHDVHVAYETSGNIAVHDDVVIQTLDTVRECGFGDYYTDILNVIKNKQKGDAEPIELRKFKGSIRRAEARAACRHFGLNTETNVHFLNLPFYETGGVKKGELTQTDVEIVKKLLREVKPHQIYAAGDLSDPHGTHRVCIDAVLLAIDQIKDDEWLKECRMWLYRGAWQEWDLDMVDMAVPLSPDEVVKKRHAIYRHLSQKDIVPFPGDDKREFWERAEERTTNTAKLYDRLGMAEYQAIEVFVKLF